MKKLLIVFVILLMANPVMAREMTRKNDEIVDSEISALEIRTQEAIATFSQEEQAALDAGNVYVPQGHRPQLLKIYGWTGTEDKSYLTATSSIVADSESRFSLGEPGSNENLKTIKIYTASADLLVRSSSKTASGDWSLPAVGSYDLAQSTGNVSDATVDLTNLKLSLDGPECVYYDLYTRVHTEAGWSSWAGSGQAVLDEDNTEGFDSLEVRIQTRNTPAPPDSVDTTQIPVLSAKTADGELVRGRDIVVGTTGKAAPLRGFELGCEDPQLEVQATALLGESAQNDPTGSGPIEAVRISLAGEKAGSYDIYYRTHVKTYGWLDWANDGGLSGTTNQNLSIEAVEIKLLPKGAITPGNGKTPSITASTRDEGRMLLMINNLRKNRGLSLLTTDEKLEIASGIRAEELETTFDHERPEGKPYFSILDDVEYRSDKLAPAIGELIVKTNDPVITFISQTRKASALQLMLTDYYNYFSFANSENGSVLLFSDIANA